MNAEDAYGDFMHDFLAWLPGQAGNDFGLLFMIRGAEIVPKSGWEFTVKFPPPDGGRRRAYLCFAQNDDPTSKVLLVEFSIGSKLTYGWLEAEATRMLPKNTTCGKYNLGKGDIFFAQTEWGRQGEWDRLYSPPARQRLFQFGIDALRFARHALDHEASL